MLKATGIVRRFDDLGRLVIPKEIRTMMGMEPGTSAEIFIREEEKEIVLRKYNPGCIFCCEISSFEYHGNTICKNCMKNIAIECSKLSKEGKLHG